MTVLRTSKLSRTLSALLAIALVATLVPVAVIPASAQVAPPRTILVLPANDQSGRGEMDLGRRVADQLVLAISAKPGLAAMEFVPTSPQVRRAVADGRLLPAQADTPPATPAAAVQVARALKMDAVLSLTLESVVITEFPKQAKVSVSGELYSVAANYNSQTGEVAATPQAERTYKVTGASPLVTNYSGSDQPLIREAIDDAISQIATATAGEEALPVVTHKKSNTGMWVALLVGVGLLAVLASNSGGDNNGSVGALPPVPGSLNVEAGGIRLTWTPPLPSAKTLLKYQIQRSKDGAPFQFIDMNLVGATATTFFDSTPPPGNYRYRIAAVYTDQSVSPFASFSQISFPH
ncbi:MAG TPA: fibronectin type III domain-containing protein [Armatimonadota bacterium]|jgi:hypothetical protein